MVTQAVSDVRAYYATRPPAQLLYGDGPGIFSANGTDISAVIDWGGMRAGSAADDIGCWTAHGATELIPLPAYTAAFCASERMAVIPIPSLTSHEAFDCGITLGADAAVRLLDHGRRRTLRRGRSRRQRTSPGWMCCERGTAGNDAN